MLQSGEYTSELNGLNLWYKVAGQGPVCVLITPGHGAGNAEFYYASMKPLEEIYTMVYLDTRGSGHSEPAATPQDYTYDNFASDLDALRQHLGLEQITIIGHSQGTMHAMYYAVEYQQHCSGLILIAPLPAFDEHFLDDYNHRVMLRKGEPWFDEAHKIISDDIDISTDEAFRQYMMDIMPFYLTQHSVLETHKHVFDTLIVRANPMVGQQAVQLDLNLMTRLHEINVPTLIAVGHDDFICSPLQSERVHLGISNSKMITFENTGHFPWLEAESIFFDRLKAGLSALGLL